jgi:hypothetical protein
MGLQHCNYFSWDTKGHRIILRGTFLRFFFFMKCRVKEEREGLRGMSPTSLDKWLKKETIDDTGHLTKVTNTFMTQHTIPTDTNQLSKLPRRTDVEVWWMINDQDINLWSEHGWTIDVETPNTRNFVGLVENVEKNY